MSVITIEKITADQILELQSISRQTFSETFSDFNSVADMHKYMEESLNIERLQHELENPESVFFFAIIDGKKAGYLKLNSGASQTELQDSDALEIERIYVLKEYLGKKIGQALYDKAYAIAKEKAVKYLWLGVWEENHRALAFYRKNGFTEFGQHIFTLGEDEQTDLMMRLEL
jgi:ribosomal protein S18 acetylase RimI-like enzyme